jgi:hypothetical protein
VVVVVGSWTADMMATVGSGVWFRGGKVLEGVISD